MRGFLISFEGYKMTVTNEGKVALLKALLTAVAVTLTIRLAKAWPGVAEKAVTFAGGGTSPTESTFGGYAAVSPGTWPTPSLNGSEEAEADATTLVWTSAGVSGSEDVVGMYITFVGFEGITYCLAAHKFAAAITIAVDGEIVSKNLNAYVQNLVP